MLNTHPRRPLLVALMVFLFAAVASASLILRVNKSYHAEARALALNLADDHADALERGIDRALSANYALSILVRQGNGVIRDFDFLAQRLLPLYPGAASLQLAPGGVVKSVFPLVGNEMVVGLDLLNDPVRGRETRRARDSRSLVFFGPYNLVRGGVGAVGWLPVFLDGAGDKPVFWGFTSVLIRFPDILGAANFPELERRGFAYELSRLDADSGEKFIFARSSDNALVEPVGYDLHLPNATWNLSIAPVKGWTDPLRLAVEAMLGLLFSLLLSHVAKLMVESRDHKKGLEALVAKRTAEVRMREAELNRAQSIAQVGSWVLDLVTNELRGSAEALRIFGVSGPINYRAFLQLVHADDREAVDRASRASLKGRPYDIEYRILSGATTRWVHSNAKLAFDANGKLENAIGTIQDITERKRAEEVQRENEERYRELFEANPQPMWVYDLDTLMFLAVNDAAVFQYGYSRDEFAAMSILDIRPPEEVPRIMQRIATVRTEDIRDAGFWRHRRKDGTLIDVEITAHTLEFGGRHAQIVHISDVTDRLRAERELRSSEERYRALTDLSSDWYWEQDEDLRFTRLSRPDAGLQEIERDTFLGKTRREASGVVWDEPQLSELDAIVAAQQPFRDFEIGRTYRSGPKRYVEMSGEPIFDALGRFAGYRGIGRDITERKEREEELRRFRAAMDATEDAIYLVDRASHRFIDINLGACRMLGLARDQIISMGPEGVLSMSREDLARIYDSVIAGGGTTEPVEMQRTRRDGRQVWIEVRRHAKQAEGGWTIVTVARDVTERKRTQQALHESESRFRSLTEMSSDFYWESDAEHRLAARDSANKKLGTISMFQRSARIGERRWEIPYLSPDDAGWQAHRAGLDAHRPFRDFEFSRLGADGNERHISIHGDPVFDASGGFKGYRGVGADITERKREEQLLRLEHAVARCLAEANDQSSALKTVMRSICETNNWGRGTYWRADTAAGLMRFGEFWSSPGLEFDHYTEGSREVVFAPGVGVVGRVWQSGEPLWIADYLNDPRVVQQTLARESGMRSVFVFPVVAAGSTVGALAFFSRVAREPDERLLAATRMIGSEVGQFLQRLQAEEHVRQINAELESRVASRTQQLEVANHELEAFSYSVSHDLRAPLRAIQGFSRMVEQQYAGQIDEKGRDMLRRVSAGAEKMGLLIDDLLRLARISRQAMHFGRVDLSVLVREVLEELRGAEPERRVEWTIAPQVSVEGDPGLLRVMLQNLIGNAWKYSSRRELARIEFGVIDKDGHPVYFVRDNGAGFDMAYSDKLFGAFQRLHTTAEFPGSGIGLATVARILHRHGGTAWAEGRENEGATFYFSLG